MNYNGTASCINDVIESCRFLYIGTGSDEYSTSVFNDDIDSNDNMIAILGRSASLFKPWNKLTTKERIALVSRLRDLYSENTGEAYFAADFILDAIDAPTFIGDGTVNVTEINDIWGPYLEYRQRPKGEYRFTGGGFMVYDARYINYGNGIWCPALAFRDLENAVLPNGNGWTALMGVLERDGNLNEIQRLINCGADINAVTSQPYIWQKGQNGQNGQYVCNEKGNTASPLLIAADLGRAGAVKHLILHGAKIDITDNRGNHIFLRALMHNHMDIVRLLLTDEDLRKHYKENKFNIYALAVQRLEQKTIEDKGEVIETILTLAIKGEMKWEDICSFTIPDIINIADKDGKTPIALALERAKKTNAQDDWQIVWAILATKGFDVNQKIDGRPLMNHFMELNQINIVNFLMKRKGECDLNAVDSKGNTPLHWAIEGERKLEDIKTLITSDNIDKPNKNGQTPLAIAIGKYNKNKYKKFRNIIEHLMFNTEGKVDLNQKIDGEPVISYVIRRGWKGVVEKMLETEKVDLNATDGKGNTPLLISIQKGRKPELIQTLITPDNADKPNADGKTPLMVAIKAIYNNNRQDYWEVIEHLMFNTEGKVDLNQKIDGTPLISILLKKKRYDLVRKMLETGKVDLNATDGNGNTSLMYAISNCCDEDIFEKLITPENADRKNNQGITPLASILRMPTYRGDNWVLPLMFNTEGKVDLNQKIEGTPLISILLKERRYDLVRQMLETGKIDLNATDENGNTPLTIAAQCYDVPNDVFNLLITDENIDKRNKEGKTPLKLLCEGEGYEEQRAKCIEKLISSGKVDVRQKIDGVPFLLFMIQHQQYGIVEKAICLYETTDMNLSADRNKSQKTPLDYLLDEQHWQYTDQCIGATRILIAMMRKDSIPLDKVGRVAECIQKAYTVCKQSGNDFFNTDTKTMIDEWYKNACNTKREMSVKSRLSNILYSQQEHVRGQAEMALSSDGEQENIIMSSLNYGLQKKGRV